MKSYSIDYFIKFFEELDPLMMCMSAHSTTGNPPQCDAWDWLDPTEQDALYDIIKDFGFLIHVNDGVGAYRNLGEDPHSRIVAFLKYIKQGRACAV